MSVTVALSSPWSPVVHRSKNPIAWLLLAIAVCFPLCAARAANYPANTGRVTDAAGILDAATQATLVTKLQALENKSGIQLVVATVRTLEGNAVEPYANALFRQWKLGEVAKSNGVLLLVAPNERKVRIEVGYGLEGTLTDAVTKIIITNAIVPRFKAGDFAGGIVRGADDIITTLTTDAAEWHGRPIAKARAPYTIVIGLVPLLILGCFGVLAWKLLRRPAQVPAGMAGKRPAKYRSSSGKWVRDTRAGAAGSGASSASWSSSSSGSGSSSSSSSDSFSGGGGSSGGGGASGDW